MALLALGLLAAGCSDSNDDEAGDSASAPSSTAADGSANESGCGATDPAEPGTERLTYSWDGVDREVERVVPASYDSDTPQPVVVDLHGFSSSIEQTGLFSGLPTAAGERGYVLLTPQGEAATVTVGDSELTASMWNLGQEGSEAIPGVQDDAGFINDMLDRTQSELCIDADRIYVTGNSNGAGMASVLVCEYPGRFAAVAPVSGVNLAPECDDPSAVSMIAFHGDTDPLVPYGGGLSERTAFDSSAVEESVSSWAAASGCGSEAEVSTPFDDVSQARWVGCDAGLDVELYTVLGGGHTWPGMLNYLDAAQLGELAGNQALVDIADLDVAEIAGHMTVHIEATALMLDFFDTHTAQ